MLTSYIFNHIFTHTSTPAPSPKPIDYITNRTLTPTPALQPIGRYTTRYCIIYGPLAYKSRPRIPYVPVLWFLLWLIIRLLRFIVHTFPSIPILVVNSIFKVFSTCPRGVHTPIGSLDYYPTLQAPPPPTLFLTHIYKHLLCHYYLQLEILRDKEGLENEKVPDDTLSPSPSTPNYCIHPKLLHFTPH